MRKWIGGAALVLSCAQAHAGGVEALKSFIAETKGARMEFVQTVADNAGRKVQESSGNFQFSRPGRFRWLYVKPYEQLIVGDGAKVWVYDKDLNQVTVKALGDALGSSPAALLAGNNDVDKAYTFTPLPRDKDLEWLEAVPKDPDSTFEKMRLGFRRSNPEMLYLHDRLGQVTTIRFTKVDRNPRFAGDTFKFVPPKDADVVGDR
ncbi:MAG: outer membrane lipoprotein chaperone LolA [Burkholderiales bacterium]